MQRAAREPWGRDLGERAVRPADHLVAGRRSVGDSGPDCLDDPRDVGAEHRPLGPAQPGRQPGGVRDPLDGQHVATVDAGGADSDQDAVLVEGGVGQSPATEAVGRSVGVVDDRMHRCLLWIAGVGGRTHRAGRCCTDAAQLLWTRRGDRGCLAVLPGPQAAFRPERRGVRLGRWPRGRGQRRPRRPAAGRVVVSDPDGQVLDVGPAKSPGRLAALALSPGSAVPVPRLVDAVWGQDPPRTAERTLQSYLARLRGVLGGVLDHQVTRCLPARPPARGGRRGALRAAAGRRVTCRRRSPSGRRAAGGLDCPGLQATSPASPNAGWPPWSRTWSSGSSPTLPARSPGSPSSPRPTRCVRASGGC